MGLEYKIQFKVPENYDPTALFERLPSPIQHSTMAEIYNYRIERDGFYFIDYLVNDPVASHAFRQFINEALSLSEKVEVLEP
jgi:hypothetical protein